MATNFYLKSISPTEARVSCVGCDASRTRNKTSMETKETKPISVSQQQSPHGSKSIIGVGNQVREEGECVHKDVNFHGLQSGMSLGKPNRI